MVTWPAVQPGDLLAAGDLPLFSIWRPRRRSASPAGPARVPAPVIATAAGVAVPPDQQDAVPASHARSGVSSLVTSIIAQS